jgi:glycosyltransferase involved in cell wall biosynthesis
LSIPTIALDISPLGERQHTGISNVAKHLAIEILGDDTVAPAFYFNRTQIPVAVVEKLVNLSRGDLLQWVAGRLFNEYEAIFDVQQGVVGIYAAHKWHRRYFPIEVQIIHDLTPVLTPQFHTPESVNFWRERLFGDMASSDLIVAVSKCTEMDIRSYYPQLAHIPTITVLNGPCYRPIQKFGAPHDVEPYVAVLGTLEPRKHIEFILECLSQYADLAERITFLFIGRFGWGDAVDKLVRKHSLEELVKRRRIRFTGFVSDSTRDALLAHARLVVVYPSQYEGFGLPVLEALAHGIPVLTTFSSSLPEVGGDLAMYCDPADAERFAALVRGALDLFNDTQAAARRKEHAAQFNWTMSYHKIKTAALRVREQQRH